MTASRTVGGTTWRTSPPRLATSLASRDETKNVVGSAIRNTVSISGASDLRALATDDAVWVYEHAREHTADLGPAWQIVDRRVYGGTAVSIASAASLAE